MPTSDRAGEEAPFVEEVFVTGGTPTYTYVARSETPFEQDIRRSLRRPHKVLAVTGPSKSGKTTLLQRVIRESERPHVAVSGASLATVDDFWRILAHHFAIAASTAGTQGTDKTSSHEHAAGLGGTLSPLSTEHKVAFQDTASASWTFTDAVLSEEVKKRLLETGTIIMIDDFHYAPAPTRVQLAREFKDLIHRGVNIILIAIPTRVMDLLESETELTGRVQQAHMPPWTELELMRIAALGMAALNLSDPGGRISARLVAECQGNPLLMQELCLQLCDTNDVAGRKIETLALGEPLWDGFFGTIARQLRPALAGRLRDGAVERRRRSPVQMNTGARVDMYEAVLIALSRSLPELEVSLTVLSNRTTEFLSSRPARDRLRTTCVNMARIADDVRGDSDPAFSFNEDSERVNVIDPYLAFYLKWGLWDMGLPPDPPTADEQAKPAPQAPEDGSSTDAEDGA